ncbi:UNVERIFIED_CONTAM: protein CROWDED NUCLEI 1 [Sesamum latifolium]|uniref:Protein CROWDED NUCLEI 1 n=1 Tax=Sesamum latifolium TaxID=2727402 RepID=A0AAW2X9B1_9LAMI
MFTPQKLWSLTPRSATGQKNGSLPGPGSATNQISPTNGEVLAKGKAVTFLEGDGVMDQQSLTERASKLENEFEFSNFLCNSGCAFRDSFEVLTSVDCLQLVQSLFEYQYNMGLLLIEKKEWAVKYEELRQALAETTDTLKREQTAHSSALSEVEKREENLKKALGVERQCVLDLEKALREMRSEYAEIKFNADSKLAEANALVTSVEEKSLEVEAKFHAADAKLAEVSRKSSEMERKLHELEAQEMRFAENGLCSPQSMFEALSSIKVGRPARVERKLQEAEERLADSRRLLNQREERANENDKILKEKQNDLEEEADDFKKRLEEKEKQLLELEEKLNTREKVEIQKLVDEHKSILTEKQKEGREKSLKVEEQNLEKERKQILAEKEDLLRVKDELENLKADSEKLQLRLNEEREQLKVTEEERTELARLQSELKQEIDKYRFKSEELMKEADDLKEAKEKFEKEWEKLDDKRAEIKKEQEERELEALKLAQDSFAASMEHEKSILAEKSQSEKSQLTHDFEMRKQELEAEMRRKQEEIETRLHEKEKAFEQEREMELNNINYLREVARREMEEMKLERLRIEKEKLEISQNKKHVEAQQHEMKKDIEELKNCDACGETIREFMLSDLHPLTELENLEAPPLPRIAENYLKEAVEGTVERFGAESSPGLVNSGSPTTGGTISWLRKCTSKIFKFSPGKKLELDYAQDPMGISALSEKQVVGSAKTLPSDVSALSEKQVVGLPETSPSGEKEPEASLQVANDSFDFQIVESDSAVREVEAGQALSVDQDPLSVPENSQNSKLKAQRRPGKGGRPRASRTRSVKAAVDGSKTNGNVENSVYTNDNSQAESDLVGTPKNIRKRNHTATVSDNQTEGHSDSIKDGDRLRRRQRVVAAEPSLGQKRYNLRQPKKSVGTVANGSLPRVGRGKEKETNQLAGAEANQSENVEIGGASRMKSMNPEQQLHFLEDLGTEMVMSLEVNGMAEGARDYSHEEFKSESHGGEDDNNDGDDDEVDHPGEVSIGKKLWTFLTT